MAYVKLASASYTPLFCLVKDLLLVVVSSVILQTNVKKKICPLQYLQESVYDNDHTNLYWQHVLI
jgi:hypothetical protein